MTPETLRALAGERPRCVSMTAMGWQCRHKVWREWDGMPYCWQHLHSKKRGAVALLAMAASLEKE